MALIVEDGTGKADAESYLSVADLAAYATARGYALTGGDPEKEAALRQATSYLDARWRYKAVKASAAQALEFPRTGLTDWSGLAVPGVPKRVKDATAELAIKVRAGTTLFDDAERGGAVKSETVGPISVTYADGAPADKRFAVAENLLQPFIKNPKDLQGGPSFGGATEGTFTVGMNDNPGTAPEVE